MKNLQGLKMFQILSNYNFKLLNVLFLFFVKECDYLISPK